MTSQSGGGGLPPGISGDGQTPGGEIIAGALTAGDPNAASVPSFHVLNGYSKFEGVVGNDVDGDDVVDIYQRKDLTANSFATGLWAERNGVLNGFDYSEAFIRLIDNTASAQAVLEVVKSGSIQFQVDGDGVAIHGKFKTGASTAHALGAYSGNAVPIYDESGTLLGYMPLYA